MSKELFVTQSVFNKEVLSPGTAVRLEGFPIWSHKEITGNYLVQKNELLELHLVTVDAFGETETISIDMLDINDGLKIKVVDANE